MSKLNPEIQLRDWAEGRFQGKYLRGQKEIIQVVSIGFLFVGQILRNALGVQAPEIGIDPGVSSKTVVEIRPVEPPVEDTVGDGDENPVVLENTEPGESESAADTEPAEQVQDSDSQNPDSEPEKRGPGRPKKNK